jgi:hypothetical protein
MSIQMVLLPVFVLIGLTFVFLFGIAGTRGRAANGAPRQPNGSVRAVRIGEGFVDQLPVLFYVLIALALPLRHADLIIVMLSWVFVVAWLAHAGILATSNDARSRSLAWLASAIVLFAMWLYFALKILLLL